MEFFNFSFWQQFFSNLGATFIGAALGILAAIWANNLIEVSSEKERKRKILTLLRAELNENLDLIKNWSSSPDLKETVAIVGHDIKTEVWASFSDGGELQWIKDPELLGKLSNAFFRLKNLKELGDWTDIILYHSNTTQEPAKNRMWERFMQKPEACVESITTAIQYVDAALNKK